MTVLFGKCNALVEEDLHIKTYDRIVSNEFELDLSYIRSWFCSR